MNAFDEIGLSDISDELNLLTTSDNPILGYDALADALFWSDEFPPSAVDEPERFWALQQVLRFRTTLIVGKPDDELELVWQQAKSLFPDWPGFLDERCNPNVDFERKYREYHQRAIDSFRSLPD